MTKTCPNCGNENKDISKFCESCGTSLSGIRKAVRMDKETKSESKGIISWWKNQGNGIQIGSIIGACCLGLILIVAVGGILSPDATTTTTSPNTAPTSSSTPSTDTSSSDSSVTSATVGQEQAAEMAESYLDSQSFSRKGLIEQLEYEGFTHQEAEYGVDQTGADWNEQAAKKAESYLRSQSFSRKGLIEQLEYEGFTRQQAEYGVRSRGIVKYKTSAG